MPYSQSVTASWQTMSRIHAYAAYFVENAAGFMPDGTASSRAFEWFATVSSELGANGIDQLIDEIGRCIRGWRGDDERERAAELLLQLSPDRTRQLLGNLPDEIRRLREQRQAAEEKRQREEREAAEFRAKLEAQRRAEEERTRLLAAERDRVRHEVRDLLRNESFDSAERAYRDRCSAWWPRTEYDIEVSAARAAKEEREAREVAQKLAEERQRLRERVMLLIEDGCVDEAARVYQDECAAWWGLDDYRKEVKRSQFVAQFAMTYQSGTLAKLDALFLDRPFPEELDVEDYVDLKLPMVQRALAQHGIVLDEEQRKAIGRPERRLQIRARAGSGKTKTLSARAIVVISDEQIEADRILILAFNKAAAEEVRQRVRTVGEIDEYSNARTFHSLAYNLVKPQKKLLFNVGQQPSEREQSLFVQRLLQRILNPAFKEAMVEFFRQELQQVEAIGRDLDPAEYYCFRRALEHVTLGAQWVREDGRVVRTNGEKVKSSGEKIIADFLFEHDIEYRYERAWVWRSEFLDGAPYRPDFSLLSGGKDFILEHWAIDPVDLRAEVPDYWRTTTEEYRNQMRAKRAFWQSKGIPLLETHAGMLSGGREVFEARLKQLLEEAGIRCTRLPAETIIKRVFDNDFVITRIAELFLTFIQRAKKRGWSADVISERIKSDPDKEPRARIFHELALRAYREYEAMLEEDGAMDFDDLVAQAAAEVNVRGGAATIHLGQGRMLPLKALRAILIDEYQDFSELYFRMLEAILNVAEDVSVMAVGDDWQAINAFAGAERRFFEKFSDFFPGAETVDVTTNYRSDKAVVLASNRLMDGLGPLAKPSRDSVGQIQVLDLKDTWIQFKRDPDYEDKWQEDRKYLPEDANGQSIADSALRRARALKHCVSVLRTELTPARFSETVRAAKERGRPYALLLARTGRAYGMELAEFRSWLIEILASISEREKSILEPLIVISTAHRAKGRQADTVVLLDATQRQFPKIHPDNLLFELFGVTPRAVLDEERRLFYVAMTRAERRLVFLTEKGSESPFLEQIRSQPDYHESTPPQLPPQDRERSDLANRLRGRLQGVR